MLTHTVLCAGVTQRSQSTRQGSGSLDSSSGQANPLTAANVKPESVGLWFFVAQRAADASLALNGRHFSKNGVISYTSVRIHVNYNSPGTSKSKVSLSLAKAIDGFLKYKTAEGLSQRTITSFEFTLGHWLKYIGDQEVSEIQSSDLTGYMA